MSHTLILGIGNTLLTDEGIGIHVTRYLEDLNPPSEAITYLDGGTLSFTLAADIEAADNLIVIDAAQLKAPAGTVQVFINESMDKFLGSTKRSVHEVGLLDLMDIARLTDTLPANRALVGIQPESIDWGDSPTSTVRNSMEQVAAEVNGLIQKWQQIPPPGSNQQENTGEKII